MSGLFAAAGIGAGLRSAAEGMDSILKSSETLGISTENLIGLHHAAGLADVSIEALDKSLFKMQDSLATAAQTGKGPASDAFKRLGLDVKKLVEMRPDEAFSVIGDALNGVGNTAQRNAIALDIFGKGAQQVATVLKMGGAGINAATQEAERLGITFSKVDAEKVDAAGDALFKVKAAAKGAFQQFAIGLSPAITQFGETGATAFAGVARKVGEFVSTGIKEIGFFFGTMDVRWQILKVNAAITWDTMKASAVGFYKSAIAGMVAMALNTQATFKNILIVGIASWTGINAGLYSLLQFTKDVFREMGLIVVAWSKATVAAMDANFRLQNPLKAFQETLIKNLPTNLSIGDGMAKVGFDAMSAFSDSLTKSGGLAELNSVGDAMGAAFNEGFEQSLNPKLDAEKKRLQDQLAGIRKTFDEMGVAGKGVTAKDKEGIGAFAGTKTAGPSTKLAAAAQIGTTEAASQITASMTAFNSKDDKIEKNTALTVEKLEEVRNAISENSMPDFDVIPAF